MKGKRGNLFHWAAVLALAATAPIAQAAMWYIPLGDQVPGGFDHIQILSSNGFTFDIPAMSNFVGSPAAETWKQTFVNNSHTFASAAGPNLSDDPLYFDVWVSGDRNLDRPIFQYQAYNGSTLVSSADVFCTGFGETDWTIQNGTWITRRPAPTFLQGDTDKNTIIDMTDLSAWQLNYTGPTGTGKTWEQGDWNGDGAVDLRDVSQWQVNYSGPQPMPSMEQIMAGISVPEPATVSMLLIASTGLMARRRAK